MNDPRNIQEHARSMVLEQIMAMVGRGQSKPAEFRRRLEAMDGYELGQFHAAMMGTLETETTK